MPWSSEICFPVAVWEQLNGSVCVCGGGGARPRGPLKALLPGEVLTGVGPYWGPQGWTFSGWREKKPPLRLPAWSQPLPPWAVPRSPLCRSLLDLVGGDTEQINHCACQAGNAGTAPRLRWGSSLLGASSVRERFQGLEAKARRSVLPQWPKPVSLAAPKLGKKALERK